MSLHSPASLLRAALARGPKKKRTRAGMLLAVSTAIMIAATGCSAGTSTAGSSNAAASGTVDEVAYKAAQDAVAKFSGPQTAFTGPTSGPKLLPGKRIVYVSCSQLQIGCVLAGKYITEIGTKIGWNVTTIDGKGSVSGWLSALNQAIALNPDGIMQLGIDPTAVQAPFTKAKELKIPIVSIFALPKTGTDPAGNVFYNEGQDGEAAGEAMANAIIADAKGSPRVVLLYDNIFALSRAKTEGFTKVFKACSSCTVLESLSSPIASVATDGPGQVSGWVNKYGSKPFYILTVGDVVVDSLVPTLKSRGIAPDQVKLIGADGAATAYERIRTGQYQFATIANPYKEVSYNTIDQMNRALSGVPAFAYTPDPYLVEKGNIDAYGGKDNVFEAGNDFENKYLTLWGLK